MTVATDREYGLSLDREPASGIAARITSGTAFPGIPVAGHRQSGLGRERALETLDPHLETESVVVSTGERPINPLEL